MAGPEIATKPLEEPLPGGSDGARVRVHPLLTAEVLVPDALMHRRTPFAFPRAIGIGIPKSKRVWIPAPAFLIEHPTAGAVLVDTGIHPRAGDESRKRMGASATWLYDFRYPDGDLPAQLRARGVESGDVGTVVMTHLHTDHASAISEFPQATFVVDHREWVTAHRRPASLAGYYPPHFEHPFDWRVLDFAGAAPAEGFDGAFDLFGDGSVTLLATPGHTPGHFSVLARAGQRDVLLTGDAAYTKHTIADGTMPGIARDDKRFAVTLAQLQRFVKARPETVVITGHDRETWPTLEAVYA